MSLLFVLLPKVLGIVPESQKQIRTEATQYVDNFLKSSGLTVSSKNSDSSKDPDSVTLFKVEIVSDNDIIIAPLFFFPKGNVTAIFKALVVSNMSNCLFLGAHIEKVEKLAEVDEEKRAIKFPEILLKRKNRTFSEMIKTIDSEALPRLEITSGLSSQAIEQIFGNLAVLDVANALSEKKIALTNSFGSEVCVSPGRKKYLEEMVSRTKQVAPSQKKSGKSQEDLDPLRASLLIHFSKQESKNVEKLKAKRNTDPSTPRSSNSEQIPNQWNLTYYSSVLNHTINSQLLDYTQKNDWSLDELSNEIIQKSETFIKQFSDPLKIERRDGPFVYLNKGRANGLKIGMHLLGPKKEKLHVLHFVGEPNFTDYAVALIRKEDESLKLKKEDVLELDQSIKTDETKP